MVRKHDDFHGIYEDNAESDDAGDADSDFECEIIIPAKTKVRRNSFDLEFLNSIPKHHKEIATEMISE